MDNSFDLITEPTSHSTVITARGDLDIESAPALAAAIADASAAGATLIVLDLKAVEFLDSSGLRSIVAAGGQLKAAGRQLLISGMSGAARRVLEIAGLLDEYGQRVADGELE
ncbi:MAG: Anti-sigma factor antagonist [Ilumatobacteraceae bacterium]|nr:Anti-sigma factor antagonist [Ilumatobacteraceae bacterium]